MLAWHCRQITEPEEPGRRFRSHTHIQSREVNVLLFDVLSSLSSLPAALKGPQQRSDSTPAADSAPIDSYSSHTPNEMLFYKPVPALMKAPETAAPTNTNSTNASGGLDLNALTGKIASGIADITALAKNIPGLAGMASALRIATNTLPRLAEALAAGDTASVQRHCSDLCSQICGVVSSLAGSGVIKMSPELAKMVSKSVPVLGTVVSGIDLGIDKYREWQAPSRSEEERCYRFKGNLDFTIGMASAAEALTGPLAPALAAIVLALAISSMLIGAYGGNLREQRQKSETTAPPTPAPTAPQQTTRPNGLPPGAKG